MGLFCFVLFFFLLNSFFCYALLPSLIPIILAHLRGSKMQCQCRYGEEKGICSGKACFATREKLLSNCPLCVSFLWVLCVFSETLWQPCPFTCRFCLCIFKLNHEQKGCALSSTCDRALSMVLLLLALKMLWLFPHSASSKYELCDWPWWCKIVLCFVLEDIRHCWSRLLCRWQEEKMSSGVGKKKKI